MSNTKSFTSPQKNKSNAKLGHKWQEVRNYLLSKVSAGNYGHGDVLPSENYLCEKVNVSRSTVRQALRELESEGMVYRIKGKGTFLSDHKSLKNAISHEMFGLIVPGVRRSQYPSLMQGFDEQLYSVNFQTMVCQTGNDVDKQGNIVLRLLHRGIDGIAIVPSTSGKTPAFQIQLLKDNGIPVVLCHRGVSGVENVPVLMWDRQEVGRIAGKALLESGHRDIAYFGVYKYEVSEAHVKGLKQVGLNLPKSRIVYGPLGDSEAVEAEREKVLANMLLSDKRPSAIFCSDDNEAEAVYWLAQRMGIKVPQELSIVGFGDSHRNSVFRRLLTSVVVDEQDLGVRAAKILCDMKKQGKTSIGIKTEVLELGLSQGKTICKK